MTTATVPGTIICDCGHMESEHSPITRGYATDKDGRTFCYDCTDKLDIADRDNTGRWTAYLNEETNEVTNWTGTIRCPALGMRRSHSYGCCYTTRIDFWFVTPDKAVWHGRQQGENTQIARCKRTKRSYK